MKKIKKIFVYFLLIAIIVSNLTFNIYDIKTYALVETVVLSEEVIKAIILTLSGSAISSDLSDSQKLELYNSNKKSYMETVQFIIDNPDLSIEMIAEDQKENFMSACASLNFTASNIDEMNKYIDGSLACK